MCACCVCLPAVSVCLLCVSAVCVCLLCVSVCCVLVQDLGAPPDPPLRRTAFPQDRPSAGLSKFHVFFFPSPATVFFLSSLSWGSFRGILVVFECRDPEMCTFGLSRRAHFRVPAFKHHQNSTKGPLRERERRKKENCGGRREKKNVKFCAPHPSGPNPWGPHPWRSHPSGPHPSGPHHSGAPPFGAPLFVGLGSQPPGPHPCMKMEGLRRGKILARVEQISMIFFWLKSNKGPIGLSRMGLSRFGLSRMGLTRINTIERALLSSALLHQMRRSHRLRCMHICAAEEAAVDMIAADTQGAKTWQSRISPS